MTLTIVRAHRDTEFLNLVFDSFLVSYKTVIVWEEVGGYNYYIRLFPSSCHTINIMAGT